MSNLNVNAGICKRKETTVNFGVNILTHCTFLLAIIGSVFFLFTEKIMSNAINNQIIDLATSSIDDFYAESTPDRQASIRLALKQANLETVKKIYSSPSEDRVINNTWVEKLVYIIVGLLILVVIIAVLVAKAQCGSISIIEILSENIIIFAFVGVVEFMFFTKIIIKYIPGYPATLSNIFLDQLKAYVPPTN